jgi:predicted dehydrogenase
MKKLLSSTCSPKSLIMTMNAGYIPKEHWTQDLEVGGGRVIGEACHYIDLMRHLVGYEISSVRATSLKDSTDGRAVEDCASITLGFVDGSMGTIHYFANGSSLFPKERIEVFTEGKVLQLDNFRKLKGYGWKGFAKMNLWRQNKGQAECIKSFVDSITLGSAPSIPVNEIFEVTRVSLEASDQIRNQKRN